jgi:murein DD-endopeptidase MepM/ murein hydrolase activator NlpD
MHKLCFASWLTFSSEWFLILVSSFWLLLPTVVNSSLATDQAMLLAQRAGTGQRSSARRSDLALYPLPVEPSVGLGYGWRIDPVTGKTVFHSGVDLLAPSGTPVLAVDDGVVAFAGQRGSYGNIVVVNHQSGRQTRYAQLGSISVGVGQRVQRGDTLGKVGSTGQPDIDQSHLHFELRYNSPKGWVAQDPLPWLGIDAGGSVVR